MTWFNPTVTALRGMLYLKQPLLRDLNEVLTLSARVSGLLHPKLESKTSLPTLMALLSEAEVMQTLCVHGKANVRK